MTSKEKQIVSILAARCVEEILEAVGAEGGKPFYVIVENYMKELLVKTRKSRRW